MSSHEFSFGNNRLIAGADGALWWPEKRLLCISDLHLGKSDRHYRRFNATLPPYDSQETLMRLSLIIDRLMPKTVLCLGDSFDDPAACSRLTTEERQTLDRISRDTDWIWILGNHDPQIKGLAGRCYPQFHMENLSFRHIATDQILEISGHFHPKTKITAKGASLTAPCFLIDSDRVIMPAFGTYTGGLHCNQPPLLGMIQPDGLAVLTGQQMLVIPVPR